MVKDATKAVSKPEKKKNSFVKRFTQFFKDLKSEIKKVVWPSKKQIKNNTVVVLVFMAVTGVFIWLFDFIFTWLIKLILG